MRCLQRQLCVSTLCLMMCLVAQTRAAHAASAEPGSGAAGQERAHISVPYRAKPQIKIDGELNEPIWQDVPAYDGLRVIDPDTLVKPRYQTLVRYIYNDRGLYMGVYLEQPNDTLVARLSSRDSFINRDEFGITLDTSGQGLYGYWFSTALGGSVKDGKVAPERQFSSEWDGPWERATAVVDDGWSMEVFLPWSMMAMPHVDGKRVMGFWVTRKLAVADERWSSPALPFTGSRFMTALGKLEMASVNPRQQFAIFPFASYTYDDIGSEDEYRAGADVFWRPSSNFQLTATANPDFGAVESDDVVVNLTAFETFFPEKRLFFLEGEEVFRTTPRGRPRSRGSSSSGARQTTTTFSPTPTTLVNTRRIGGVPEISVPDDVTVDGAELGRPAELIGAAKVTGQAGGMRWGVLSAFEEDVKRYGTRSGQRVRLEAEGRDFGVARLLYETTESGGGRRSIGYIGTLVTKPEDDAEVHGIDTHLLSSNGRFSWDSQFVTSDVGQGIDQGFGAFMDFKYVPNRNMQHTLALDYFDEDLDISDLGFIRRNDAIGAVYNFSTNKTFSEGRFRKRSTSLLLSYEENQDGRPVRGGIFLRNKWQFNNLAEIGTEVDWFPGRYDDRNSFGNGTYKTEDRWVAEVSYGTDTAKPISFSVLAGMRQEELGDWTTRLSFGATLKPNDRFSFDFDVGYFRRDGWLVYQEGRNFTTFDATDWQPRFAMDIFLSARQQIRLTMQWAGIRAREQQFWQTPVQPDDIEQRTKGAGEPADDFTISRLTAQLRYRWEIGPLSDLFVVYTRGSNVPDRMRDEFGDLFHDALTQPIIDVFTIKLRYRFGR